MRETTSDVIGELFSQYRETLDPHKRSSLFADDKPIMVYGMGTVGRNVFELLTRHGLSVYGILDKKAAPGAMWRGVPIFHPDDGLIPIDQRKAIHLVVGVFNAYVDINELVAYLTELGYATITSFLDLHHQFSVELGDRFWLTNRVYYRDLEPAIRAGYQLWTDDASRALYVAMLRFRLSGDYSVLPSPDLDSQYLPADIPPWVSPMRLVDCGAYDGDTIRQMLMNGVQFDAFAAFEPDQANFTKLAKYVGDNVVDLPETVCLFPNGAHSCTEQLRFASGGGSGSHISESGETVIQCSSLDEAIPNFRPTLIKMDIEGAEYEALWGARNLIRQYRPGLAICLYHRPEHLWQIPLLVNGLSAAGYHLFLRAHCNSGFELVMYGIPVA